MNKQLSNDLIILFIAVLLFISVLIYNHFQDNKIERLENLNEAFLYDMARIINEQKIILIEQRKLNEKLENK